MYQTPTHTSEHKNTEHTTDAIELSTTLVERRKRLHNLANEINNWEDESTPQKQQPLVPTTPQPTHQPQFTFNKTPTSYSTSTHSPRKFQLTLTKQSPINSTVATNTSLTKIKTSPFNTNQNQIKMITNNINKENEPVESPSKRKSTSDHVASNSLVRNIKAKFESGLSNINETTSTVSTVAMTPKSIIKKFEQMSQTSGHQLNGSVQPNQNTVSSSSIQQSSLASHQQQSLKVSTSKTAIPPSTPFQVNLKKTNHDLTKTASSNSVASNSEINNEHINPKSIIERFEQLTKINNQSKPNQNAHQSAQPLGEFLPQNGAILSSSQSNQNLNANNVSLTYISSLASSNRPSQAGVDTNEPVIDEQASPKDDAIYEELNQNENKESMITSLFEDSSDDTNDMSDENTAPTTTDANTQETYSISSSYSGSIINQEFDDIIETDTNEYTAYTDQNYTTEEDDENETCTTASMYDDTTPSTTTAATSTITITTTFDSNSIQIEQTDAPAQLFSIKEYRKQKKYAGGLGTAPRRSSILTNPTMQPNLKNRSKSKLITSVNTAPKINPESEEHTKQMKYLERTKELEELIKQEDNVIYQTGIALERCLTDSNFTGSSEHIECNRILLISCQKRQAYLTEINRVRQLIQQLKRPQQQQLAQNEKSEEFNAADLTGLLIFSDLQLPIKESYLNKLKSGDEKRIFYFLCLIRNGIQVLQTQVISVQELIANRDTLITFPNRMAISNVDVNFKVKIDVYALEMLPKENKPHKPVSSSAKFFSPFKHLSSHHHNSSNHHNSISNHFNDQINTTNGSKTSNFIHLDTIEITIKDLTNSKFKLNISSSSIPLTGILYVNVRCMPSKSIELKGFMTLFEDSNGLRSWDRRWCFLNNYNISYWKYPEDEYKNSPIGIINLTKCLNSRVQILPRDLCARKYTIELLISDAEDASSESIKRFRLSADNKEQANDWLQNINYALANLRLWNPKAVKPLKQ